MILYDNDAHREGFMELVYDLLRDDGTNDRANQIIAAFDSVPEVEAEPLPPNDPLTLEELQEMAWSQSPVWCSDTDGLHAGLMCIRDDWCAPGRTPHIWLLDEEGNSGVYSVKTLLKAGAVFYHRKPEEVTT